MKNQGQKKRDGGAAPARIAALDALLEVESHQDIGSGEALDRAIGAHKLESRDARLATAIVYGVLRRAMWLDLQYASFLQRQVADLEPGARALFRMAACQRFLMERIPPHAITSDSVELGRRRLGLRQHATGFINAIVRRIVAMETPHEPDSGDRLKRLSVLYSYPEWLVRMFEAKYGSETAEGLLAAGSTEAPVTLRVNRLTTDGATDAVVSGLELEGVTTEAGTISPDALILSDSGRLRDLIASPLFQAGALYVQDEASQVVAHLAAPMPGERILDLCAAPGGKATHLAELADGKARVVATDISDVRLNLVRENAQRLGTPGLEIISPEQMQTAREQGDHADLYDLVLVDAPCSGLGTLRRNPEIRYRCSRKSIKRLAGEQRQILEAAAQFVRPGGRIVYSTCTITDDENRGVIESFLGDHSEFSLSRSRTRVQAIQSLRSEDGLYRTWPAYPGADGFEAAVLIRKLDGDDSRVAAEAEGDLQEPTDPACLSGHDDMI